ncbi:MAG: universal stress protein [Chloroflexota bacterium]|jgi:nucleotide-binding universal stress UspA family protein
MYQCQRILVPLDGSPLAERALPAAVTLAQAFSQDSPCELHLLRIVPPIVVAMEPTLYTETIRLGEEEAQAYLAAVAVEWANSGVPIVPASETGSIAESIITYAQEQAIHLIVISSHGRSGLSRWVYGSVTEKVLRQACCAILVIREQVEEVRGVFRKIMVCLDGSPLAEQVLDPALTLAQCGQAEVILLRAVQSANLLLDLETPGYVQENLTAIERGDAETYLQHLLERLPDIGSAIITRTVIGPPADAIIDEAAAEGVDLIAMSSHGRSGLSRWVYGSVTEKVLRGAKCATLIVRDKNV